MTPPTTSTPLLNGTWHSVRPSAAALGPWCTSAGWRARTWLSVLASVGLPARVRSNTAPNEINHTFTH